MNTTLQLAWTFVIRDLARNKIRAGLTISAIALGVAVMLAIWLANASVLGRFRESIDLVSGKANLCIYPASDKQLSEDILTRLDFLFGEKARIKPVIEELAVIPGERRDLLRVIGIDMLAYEDYRIDNKEQANSFWDIFEPRQAYFSSETARKYKLKKGDSLKLLINDREETLKCAGVLNDSGAASAFGGNVIFMDIGCAQDLFGMQGHLTRVELILPDNRLAELKDTLKRLLPENLSVERPERRGKQVEKMLKSFQYNLTALSLIALLVGAFLIYNTMSISVIRRRWEIGTLKALGLSASSVFALVSLEALLLGCAGSFVGVAGGVKLADFALKAVSRTVQALYVDQPAASVELNEQTLIAAFFAGTILSWLAALAPALEAVSISPAEATRRASYERKVERLSGKLAAFALLLFALAALAAVQAPIENFPFWGYLAAALSVFAFAALCPLLLGFLLKKAKIPLAQAFGMEARLASASLHGALGRTSVTVATLVLGISMMVSLAVMIGSFRQTVISWAEQTLKADLWLEPEARAASNRTGALSQEVEKTIARTKGVEAIDCFVEFLIEYEGMPCYLGAGDLEVMAKYGNLLFQDNENCRQVLERVKVNRSFIVSEPFALKHKKSKGDIIELRTSKGLLRGKIEGIYYDYASDLGYIVMSRDLFASCFKDRQANSMAVFLKPGFEAEEVRDLILSGLPDGTRLNIRSNRQLKIEVMRVFDNTFAITYALHAISIAVAILAVMNSLFALTIEAKRDLGILRYMGASQRQLTRIILYEAGMLGFLGNCGGFILGILLSFLLIHVINKQSFGWTVHFSLPFEFLAQSFFLILFCSLVSGIVPAKLAAKTQAPEVLRSE